MDFGNFLWGNAGQKLGFSLFELKTGAQINNMVEGQNQNKGKKIDFYDDPADQKAIGEGYNYPGKP